MKNGEREPSLLSFMLVKCMWVAPSFFLCVYTSYPLYVNKLEKSSLSLSSSPFSSLSYYTTTIVIRNDTIEMRIRL